MKRLHAVIFVLCLSFLPASCAYPPDRYNTQVGAAIGAGPGALLGQAIGHSAEGTILGMASGAIFGALVGNAVDQDYQAARDAARFGKPVVYYDKYGRAVEATPEGLPNENCRTVRKRIWEHGELVKETEEEICGPPAVAYAPSPPPAIVYEPAYPSFYFYLDDGPYYRKYYRRHPYWHRW